MSQAFMIKCVLCKKDMEQLYSNHRKCTECIESRAYKKKKLIDKSPEGKAYKKTYQQRPENKAKAKANREKPEIKKRNSIYQKAYRERIKNNKITKE
tara:strand:- start:244 stop:534 length:291 start_codon:yes stop_codon:yes gene_type:complete